MSPHGTSLSSVSQWCGQGFVVPTVSHFSFMWYKSILYCPLPVLLCCCWGGNLNYIECFCTQAPKGTRTDLPRKCQLLSFSKRRLLKGKKHPPKHEIGHSIRGRNIEEEPAPNSPSFILLIPILHVMNNQHCTTRFPCCFVLMPACLTFLSSVSPCYLPCFVPKRSKFETSCFKFDWPFRLQFYWPFRLRRRSGKAVYLLLEHYIYRYNASFLRPN